jgi:hypothetical protein
MTEILVTFKDGDGLPRAYASGDEADLEHIRGVAMEQLLKYLKKGSYAARAYPRPDDYTEDIQEIKEV